jgi:hypothetical protein
VHAFGQNQHVAKEPDYHDVVGIVTEFLNRVEADKAEGDLYGIAVC